MITLALSPISPSVFPSLGGCPFPPSVNLTRLFSVHTPIKASRLRNLLEYGPTCGSTKSHCSKASVGRSLSLVFPSSSCLAVCVFLLSPLSLLYFAHFMLTVSFSIVSTCAVSSSLPSACTCLFLVVRLLGILLPFLLSFFLSSSLIFFLQVFLLTVSFLNIPFRLGFYTPCSPSLCFSPGCSGRASWLRRESTQIQPQQSLSSLSFVPTFLPLLTLLPYSLAVLSADLGVVCHVVIFQSFNMASFFLSLSLSLFPFFSFSFFPSPRHVSVTLFSCLSLSA